MTPQQIIVAAMEGIIIITVGMIKFSGKNQNIMKSTGLLYQALIAR